ncbi:MAG: glycosyltransferase family 39 protein [Thermoleophilia bacterium]
MVVEHSEPERNVGARWNSSDWLITATLFVVTLISRIPFRTTMLYAWDSVLYTRAIEQFDVRLHQPQPPGHIFYVGLVRLVNSVAGDPNAAMVWISILAAAVAVAILYFLGRIMFGRDIGLVAALLLATSLSFWLQSEVAYPYTLLGCLSVIVAAMIYPAWTGSKAWALPSALALGIASGFRQDLLPFLLPLLVLGIWDKGRWRVAGAAAILIACVAAWYIPSALLSGGFTAYREASSQQSDYLMTYFAVFGRGLAAFRANLHELLRFLLYGLSSALLIVPVTLIVAATSSGRRQFRDQRLPFLLAWIAPSLLFYIFIHIGEFGYVFSFLPALLLLLAWSLRAAAVMFASRPGRQLHANRALWVAAVPLILINLVLFLALSPPFSANRLAARDDILRSRIDTIRDNFDPKKTMVISVFDYQQANYYLPEFQHWNFDPSVEKTPSTEIPDGVDQVVIFEEYLSPADGQPLSWLPLDREQQLDILERQGAGSVRVDWESRKVYLENG